MRPSRPSSRLNWRMISVRGKVGASEDDVKDEELEDRIVKWPQRWPKGAKGRGRR